MKVFSVLLIILLAGYLTQSQDMMVAAVTAVTFMVVAFIVLGLWWACERAWMDKFGEGNQ